jgi:tetratricopeptide (TPR) repeat protein
MPPRNPNFVGRDIILTTITAFLASAQPVAVNVLHGPGGIGKSQLAIEVAYRRAKDYSVVWWVDADPPSSIPIGLAQLAQVLGVATDGVDSSVRSLTALMRQRNDWLVIFDNAREPTALRPFLLSDVGHTIVTSRNPEWSTVAHGTEVGAFSRAETTRLLQRRVPAIDSSTAHDIAEELGDLPLAAEQVGAFLTQTQYHPAQYLSLLRTQQNRALALGVDESHGGRIADLWSISLEDLSRTNSTAVDLLRLCSLFGPGAIPLDLLRNQRTLLSGPLSAISKDEIGLAIALGDLIRWSLVKRSNDTLLIHRLLQTSVRENMDRESRRSLAELVTGILCSALERDPSDPAEWMWLSQVIPHLLTAPDLDRVHDPRVRRATIAAGWQLFRSGDFITAQSLLEPSVVTWAAELGSDHTDVLSLGNLLGNVFRNIGRLSDARDVHGEVLARRVRLLGKEHPDSLTSASNLANVLHTLGSYPEAVRLAGQTLRSRKVVLGSEHPETLRSMSNLAFGLDLNGDIVNARRLHERALTLRTRVLGPAHPDTLTSMSALADVLYEMREYAAAYELHRRAYNSRAETVGSSHPHTLTSGIGMASDLYASGRDTEARSLLFEIYDHLNRVPVRSNSQVLTVAFRLTQLLVESGDNEKAITIAAQSIDASRQTFGDGHEYTRYFNDLFDTVSE